MFSVEFCAFLAVGGRFLFESTTEREQYHGFTLAVRAQLLKELPCRLFYETRQEWENRQYIALEYGKSIKAYWVNNGGGTNFVDQVSVWCPVPLKILKKIGC